MTRAEAVRKIREALLQKYALTEELEDALRLLAGPTIHPDAVAEGCVEC